MQQAVAEDPGAAAWLMDPGSSIKY